MTPRQLHWSDLVTAIGLFGPTSSTRRSYPPPPPLGGDFFYKRVINLSFPSVSWRTKLLRVPLSYFPFHVHAILYLPHYVFFVDSGSFEGCFYRVPCVATTPQSPFESSSFFATPGLLTCVPPPYSRHCHIFARPASEFAARFPFGPLLKTGSMPCCCTNTPRSGVSLFPLCESHGAFSLFPGILMLIAPPLNKTFCPALFLFASVTLPQHGPSIDPLARHFH